MSNETLPKFAIFIALSLVPTLSMAQSDEKLPQNYTASIEECSLVAKGKWNCFTFNDKKEPYQDTLDFSDALRKSEPPYLKYKYSSNQVFKVCIDFENIWKPEVFPTAEYCRFVTGNEIPFNLALPGFKKIYFIASDPKLFPMPTNTYFVTQNIIVPSEKLSWGEDYSQFSKVCSKFGTTNSKVPKPENLSLKRYNAILQTWNDFLLHPEKYPKKKGKAPRAEKPILPEKYEFLVYCPVDGLINKSGDQFFAVK